MDAKDRVFTELALRLQLLTREQVAICGKQRARTEAGSFAELAVELGFMSEDEVALVRAQEARINERQQQKGARTALVEERTARRDPRSDSSPPPAAPSPPKHPTGRGRREPRQWEAPPSPTQGRIRVPRTHSLDAQPPRASNEPMPEMPVISAPPQPSELADTAPVSPSRKPSRPMPEPPPPPPPRVRANAFHLADTAPLPAPTGLVEPAHESFAAFPLVEADTKRLPEAERRSPPPKAPSASTLHQPFSVPQPFEEPPSSELTRASVAGGTVVGQGPAAPAALARAAAPGGTLVQPFAAPAVPVIAEPNAPGEAPQTLRPPKAKVVRPAPQVAPGQGYLGQALALALREGASDLHVHSGAPLLIRVDGAMHPLAGASPISAEAAERVIAEIASDVQWATLSKKGEVDFAYEIPNLARFRVNIYSQQRGLDAVFRIVALKPPTLEQLGLPARLARLTDYRTGMVLCTGPAGCGKSTTLAALLYALTQTRSDHILTIEDPVEYVYPPGQALVNQRQVRDHTTSFSRALRAALREDPDVIAITELRDRETIGLAISAAETGHLVLGTLHTGNASQTIHRIISSFPSDEQEQVRAMLAESLRAVVSQRLVPLASGKGRVPALELLMVTTAVSNLIRDDKTHQLPSVMQTGRAMGMTTLDDSLAELVANGSVSAESARRFAVKKERFG